MAQAPDRSEPSESEHRGLPMVVPQPARAQHEGWLARVMRILFGWKAAATRADLELVLTARTARIRLLARQKPRCSRISSALRECRIESVMVPRADIVAVQQDITLGELVKVFAGAGHSRLVVYNDTLDDPIGMVHIRDLLAFMAARAALDPAAAARTQASAAGRSRSCQASIFRCR